MAKGSISSSVIRRMPRYYRFLGELERQGVVRISSRELAERMGLTASQIRQDLNCFGGFGQQGYGYNVPELHSEIGKILGVDAASKTILVGAGNLGIAIARHLDFGKRGFELIGIFDKNPELWGKEISGISIADISAMEEFCAREHPTVAILCIPKTAAFDTAQKLYSLGIRGFWNFSHYDLRQFEDVVVENVHLGDSLLTLSYGLKSSEESEADAKGGAKG